MINKEIKNSIINGDGLESGKGYSLSWALATAFVLLNNETVFNAEDIENLLWDRICELVNRKNDTWISVDDELPIDNNINCLVALYDSLEGDFSEFALDCWYDYDNKRWIGLSDLQKDFCIVKYWQPMSQPPNTEGA